MNVHFIAIGGSAMHNLAIALHQKGYKVTGSDDEIFEPSRTRLKTLGLLPELDGWFTDRIHTGLDAVILGMHARKDNPELSKALELGLKVYSYPEYLYEQSKNKKRIVIGGSHGKTTITAMILHVLRQTGFDPDYMVGAKLEGFDVMVRLSEKSDLMVIEGDEYLTSPIDPRPKFHLYKPHIALISGIAWDHINVFPTWENYIDQFRTFIKLIEPGGKLIYCTQDKALQQLVNEFIDKLNSEGYDVPMYSIKDGVSYIIHHHKEYALKVFGIHNLLNLQGAWKVCSELGIADEQFATAITSFPGAANRLELVHSSHNCAIFRDFAHAPSKLEATLNAVKEQFPERQLVACMELHTFSSLSQHFLPHFAHTMDKADYPVVYFNPHAIAHKKLVPITKQQVKEGFANEQLLVFDDSLEMQDYLRSLEWNNKNLLMMSSGNYDGLNIKEFSTQLMNKK
jgi:UDP-N-acetylmuramate: L-alanyl-gamma-D-glutamyl-meso-diaminopimelate ligase